MAEKLDLMLTLKRDQLLQSYRGGRRLDIGELIADVPTAEIKGGNRYVSVRLRVDQQQLGALRSAVRNLCTIDQYGELELFGKTAKLRRYRKNRFRLMSAGRSKLHQKLG